MINDDNRIELNQFIQDDIHDDDRIDDEDDIELGDEDERPFPDSDEAIRALQDVEEAVEEMEAEIARLRAELKTALSERDNAMRQTLPLPNGICVSMQFVGDGNADCTAFNSRNGDSIRVDEFDYDGTDENCVLYSLTSIEVIRFLSNAANMTLSKEIK